MMLPTLRYCYYAFKGADGSKQELRIWITDTLSIEWKLYVNDILVGHHLDVTTNILLPGVESTVFSYPNVLRMYNDLFQQMKNSQL